MPSINVTLNLNKLEGAQVLELADGRNGVFIPSSAVFTPVDRSTGQITGNFIVSLDIIDVPETRYHKTKIVKQHISNERWQKMTEEERAKIPIIGNGK